MKCLIIYFMPLFLYLRNMFTLSTQDLVGFGALIFSAALTTLNYFFGINYFGASDILIIIVMGTIAANTGFGIWKSKILSKRCLALAKKLKEGPDFRLQMKLYKRYQFDLKKLQFVVFKAMTFLIYLKVASTFLKEGGGFLDWTSAAIIQTPIAIMWYMEWKSIGENSETIWDKKAPIFDITEFIFEAKFTKFFKKDESKNTEV